MLLVTKRLCRKCTLPIPNRMKINGIHHVLGGRKFCLQCSPFGAHNTKQDDPSRPSKTSKSEHARRAWRITAARALSNAHALRSTLIEMSGGCCSRCGYAKYLGALEFHHVDPTTKKFGLSSGNLRGKTKETVMAEWTKCILVCANCHREIEAEQRLIERPARIKLAIE